MKVISDITGGLFGIGHPHDRFIESVAEPAELVAVAARV